MERFELKKGMRYTVQVSTSSPKCVYHKGNLSVTVDIPLGYMGKDMVTLGENVKIPEDINDDESMVIMKYGNLLAYRVFKLE